MKADIGGWLGCIAGTWVACYLLHLWPLLDEQGGLFWWTVPWLSTIVLALVAMSFAGFWIGERLDDRSAT